MDKIIQIVSDHEGQLYALSEKGKTYILMNQKWEFICNSPFAEF